MGLVLSEGGEVVSTVPSPVVALRESISLVQRQLEDATWMNMSEDDGRRLLDDSREDRETLIKRARTTVKRNPMARQAVDLLQHYTLGQGITIKAQNKSIVAKLVDEFLNAPENKATLTTHDAQKELLERAFVDGDVFLVLFVDKKKGLLRVGWLDALRVVDIIPDEQNAKMPKWLKAKAKASTFNFKSGEWENNGANNGEFVYYRWWTNEDEGTPKGMPKKAVQDGLIYQLAVDKSGLFGRSKLATAVDWLKAHREFMEDRSTLNRAAASVAWKKKRTGPASDIAREVDRLQSSIVGDPRRYEQNPTKAAGSTVVENPGSSLEWVDTNTGGASADYDERKLRMMAGSGMGGIPNHYFGDEAAANLATATAMELPLLKAYEDWQQTIRQVLIDIIRFYLAACHEAGRVGEEDLTSRYTESKTSEQAVMEQPEAKPAPGSPGGAPAAAGGAQQSSPASPVMFGEADIPPELAKGGKQQPKMPYAPPPVPGGLHMMPKDQAPEVEEPEEIGPDDPVPWYVDIDFPPIIQKETFQYMQALEKFAAMLPGEVLEAKKLVVELALSVFGVNDVDKVLERIYPPDMVGVLVPPPAQQPPMQEEPGMAPASLGESIADIRRRRLLHSVREAGAAVAGAG